MFTHLATTDVSSVARYRSFREPFVLPIARLEVSLFVAFFTLSVICLFVLCVGPAHRVEWGLGGPSRQMPRLVHHFVRVVSI